MSSEKKNYYDLLGVSRTASQEEIKSAYLQAVQKLHPDKNTAAGETEIFLDVQQAYEALANPKRREQYDATLPPEQKLNLPYEYNVVYSRASLTPSTEPQMFYMILNLQAPPSARRNPAPPLNVCIVIDRSTSMKNEKMDVVKATAVEVMRNMRPQDIVSVVSFSDRAEVVIPASYHQDHGRLEAQIQQIQPSGGTEIFQGLEAGAKEVMKSHDGKRISHIILLTDGKTYGDEQRCLDLASKLAERGVGISAMGIGDEWNDIFLDVLATRTGGSSSYIEEPKDTKKLLLEKFDTLAHVYADEATLHTKPVDGVHLSYAFRLEPDPGPINLETSVVRLGSILQDTSTRVIFEYMIQPTAVKSNMVALLDAMLKVSITSLPYPVPPLTLQIKHPVSDSIGSEQSPPEIVSALSRLMLYRMQERARVEIENGNVEAGTRQLQLLAANLMTRGERSLAQTIMLEVDGINNNHAFSEEGGKKIKYGTRALFLPAPKKEKTP